MVCVQHVHADTSRARERCERNLEPTPTSQTLPPPPDWTSIATHAQTVQSRDSGLIDDASLSSESLQFLCMMGFVFAPSEKRDTCGSKVASGAWSLSPVVLSIVPVTKRIPSDLPSFLHIALCPWPFGSLAPSSGVPALW